MPRETKNWTAEEAPDIIGENYTLSVTGDVRTYAGSDHPELSERVPQGIAPNVLALTLSAPKGGPGTAVMGWQRVEFAKPVDKSQYAKVEIDNDGEITSVDVKAILS